jgi:hypothetical protein
MEQLTNISMIFSRADAGELGRHPVAADKLDAFAS